MNTMKKVVSAGTMVAMVLTAASAVQAARGKGFEGRKHERKPGTRAERMAERFGLTEEQQSKMKDLREGMQKKNVLLQAQKDVKQAELKVLWLAEKPDKKAIMAKHGELADLQKQMTESRVDMQLALHEILTPEQRAKFCQRFGGMGEGHKGRMGRQGRMGRMGRRGGQGFGGPGMAGPGRRGAQGRQGRQGRMGPMGPGFQGGPGWQNGPRNRGQFRWQQRGFGRQFEGIDHRMAPPADDAADDDADEDDADDAPAGDVEM